MCLVLLYLILMSLIWCLIGPFVKSYAIAKFDYWKCFHIYRPCSCRRCCLFVCCLFFSRNLLRILALFFFCIKFIISLSWFPKYLVGIVYLLFIVIVGIISFYIFKVKFSEFLFEALFLLHLFWVPYCLVAWLYYDRQSFWFLTSWLLTC